MQNQDSPQSLEQPQKKVKPHYQRNLKLQEKQAYQGAKLCYYGCIPTSIVAIIFFYVYLYELKQKKQVLSQSQQAFSFAYLVVIVVFSFITYIIALTFYQRANKIQVYPCEKDNSINKFQINQDQIKTDRSLNSHQRQSDQDNSNLNFAKKPDKFYCKFCQKQAEYRTRHCKKCNTCIQRYDHHCFWIGNCVGRHNHKVFYLFLLLQSLNNLFLFTALMNLINGLYIFQAHTHFVVLFFIYFASFFCFGFLIFTGYLAIYHSVLISLGMTTWEQMRRERISYLKYLPKGHNPFSLGAKQNIIKFFTQKTRQNNENCELQIWDDNIPSFQQSKIMKPEFNLIDNEYYSCC